MRSPSDRRELDFLVFADGSGLSANVISLDSRGDTIRFAGRTGQAMQRKLSEIERIDFKSLPQAPESSAESPNVEIAYDDGSVLRGVFQGVRSEGLTVRMPLIEVPMVAGWSGLAQVRFLAAGPVGESLLKRGRVDSSGTRLHGRIVHDASAHELRWEPVMSQTPVVFASQGAARVSFEPQVHERANDLRDSELVLTNGDTIPCQVMQIDEQGLTARLADGATARIPRNSWKAFRQLRPEHLVYAGFQPGDVWLSHRRDSSQVRWRDGALEFLGQDRVARELPLPDRCRISFDIQWDRDGDFLLGVGADSAQNALDQPEQRGITPEALEAAAKQKPDGILKVILTRRGNTLTVQGMSHVAGVLGLMMQPNFRVRRQDGDRSMRSLEPCANAGTHVELLIDRVNREYLVEVNGREMSRWRDPTPLEGGFVFLGLGAYENRPASSPRTEDQRQLSVFNFQVARWPGKLAEDELDRFLTRRLGTRPQATTHALLAVNGDTLRGRLVEMNADSVVVQSRRETIAIPRQEVVAVIALDPKPNDQAEFAERVADGSDPGGGTRSGASRLRLWGGGAVSLDAIQTSGEYVRGISPLAGAVSVAWSDVAAIEFAPWLKLIGCPGNARAGIAGSFATRRRCQRPRRGRPTRKPRRG